MASKPLEAAQALEFRALLDELTANAQEKTRSVFDGLEETAALIGAGYVELAVQLLVRVMQVHRAQAAELGAAFYEATQQVAIDTRALDAASLIHESSISSMLAWAIRQALVDDDAADGAGVVRLDDGRRFHRDKMVAVLDGAVQRRIYDGARRYAMQALSTGGGRGFYRYAFPDSCSFCKMLASRALLDAPPYKTAESAITVQNAKSSRGLGETFHDNCRCIPVAAGSIDEDDPVLKRAAREYEQAAAVAQGEKGGLTAKNVTNAWRRQDRRRAKNAPEAGKPD